MDFLSINRQSSDDSPELQPDDEPAIEPINETDEPSNKIELESVKPEKPRRRHIDWAARTIRVEYFIISFGIALLLIALSWFLAVSNDPGNAEFERVASDKYQAVFIQGGSNQSDSYSTYFGHIKEINKDFLILNDVFFLTSDGDSSRLTKLGCQQLHSPYDEMTVYRSHVAYWENIKDDGAIVKAINKYKSDNPSGGPCVTDITPSKTPK